LPNRRSNGDDVAPGKMIAPDSGMAASSKTLSENSRRRASDCRLSEPSPEFTSRQGTMSEAVINFDVARLVGNVPACLRERAQWVCWTYVVRDGKRTKCPIMALGRAMLDPPFPSPYLDRGPVFV
jgi:hypothetical protein